MYSHQRIASAALAATLTGLMAGACGGADTGGMSNPTQPGPVRPVVTGTAGTTGAAGIAAVSGMGSAGRGVAGMSAPGAGLAGRNAAGAPATAAGAGAAGMGATGTGAAGMAMAGAMATAGTGGALGTAGTGGALAAAGTGGSMLGAGKCCPSGDCLCHGPDPTGLTSTKGPFATQTINASTGVIHYPMGAEPPFAGVAVCGGFLNTGPEMDSWGSFYASYGIVTIVTTTGASDQPDVRATKLLGAIKTLKDENMKSGSPLMGKMSGRYGTSGYSMGGGGTTIATGQDQTLKTSVGMAPWGGMATNVKTATLLFCGTADTTAPCSMASGVFKGIADPTPKMLVTLNGTSHLDWVGSNTAPGNGAAAKIALAFQKIYLEGDERWKPLLQMMTSGVSSEMVGNIK